MRLPRLAVALSSFLVVCRLANAQNNAPFDSNYALSCAASSGLVGGYRPADTTTTQVQTLGSTAFNEWWSTANETTCTPENSFNNRTDVISACSQVVAGTNYAMLVEAVTQCEDPEALDEPVIGFLAANITLAVKAYQPLGNAPPQITLAKLIYLNEEPIA